MAEKMTTEDKPRNEVAERLDKELANPWLRDYPSWKDLLESARDEINCLEATLSDEEDAHQETLGMLKALQTKLETTTSIYDEVLEQQKKLTSEINRLQAERDRLAGDAEVGRLVKSILERDTDILRIYHWMDGEYEYVDETHEGNEEGYTCNEQWGDTLLEALQALAATEDES